MEPKTGRSYVAELVGTFLLVFFICMVVSLTSREALGFTDWAVIGLVHALRARRCSWPRSPASAVRTSTPP